MKPAAPFVKSATTSTSVASSKAEIERMLRRYGADAFAVTQDYTPPRAPRTIPPLSEGELNGLAAMNFEPSLHEAYALAASRLGATVAAPAPEPPSVTLSDGSVVTYTFGKGERRWVRDYTGCVERLPRVREATRWPDIFNTTDTGADFDALKAFAGRVLALREGRGDDADAK